MLSIARLILMRVCLLGISFTGLPLVAVDHEVYSIFKMVMEHNQPALNADDQEWPDEDFYHYFMRCMEYQCKLSDQKKRSAVFKILDRSILKKQFIGNTICDDVTTWQDLNLFCGQKDLSVYLASIIDRTRTSFGRAVLYSMLINPTASVQELERRQGIIRHLLENPPVLQALDDQLCSVQESESMFISFWCEDPIRQEIKKERYLQWPIKALNDYVNKSETCLSILNSWGHVERFLYLRDYILGSLFVTAHNAFELTRIKSPKSVQEMSTWLQHDRGINAGPMLTECLPRIESATGNTILGLLAGLYAMMNINDWASWTSDRLYLDSCMHMKIMHVAQCVEGIKGVHQTIDKSPALKNQLLLAPSLDSLLSSTRDHSPDVYQLLALLANHSFKERPSFTTHTGRSLLCLKLMSENKAAFEDSCAAIGEIDAYVSLAKLIKEHEHSRIKYCFAQCVQADRPLLDIKDFWNQFVDEKKVVLNSLSLGTSDMQGNIIITGPNAGGKSTILKAVATSVLMAQSFGIAPAQQMSFTPFNKITTYMNIRDDIAAGNSLFKAQVLRAQELLEFVQLLERGKFCFVIIDEMFNGTSPREAEASAYSVAKNLGQHSHAMCLIATHFPLLTSLEKNTRMFSNYSVQVEQSIDGAIIYPFKLKPGISHQYIALDILRSQGFNGAILDDAHAIINNGR